MLFCQYDAKTSQLLPIQISNQFMIRTEERSGLYLYTKVQADSSIRSKVQCFVQNLQNFEIGSSDPGHAHLSVALWSVYRTNRRGMSSMSYQI